MPVSVEDAHVRKACEELGAGSCAVVIDLDGDELRLRPDRGRDPRGADTGSRPDLGEPAVRAGCGERTKQATDLTDRRALELHGLRERFSAKSELRDPVYDGVTRYASKTASTLRSAVSSDFTSPSSAVYQFFAS